jgi:hypothetical protein
MIAVDFLFVHIVAFHCRIYFHADDIAECVLWIDKTFAAVAGMMDHEFGSFCRIILAGVPLRPLKSLMISSS